MCAYVFFYVRLYVFVCVWKSVGQSRQYSRNSPLKPDGMGRLHVDDDETDAYMPPLKLSRTSDHSGKISVII